MKIAIIGISGKYPKANSPEKLWHNILHNIDMSSSQAVQKRDKYYVDKYFSVEGVKSFDAKRFRFTPQEALLTDPQHRMLLTCAYLALSDAGYPQEMPHTKFGVFATTSLSTYLLNLLLKSEHYKEGEINYPVLLGNDKDFLATKIAYKLNLTGPAMSIQCACSSSLVAMHHACQSLLQGECDLAITGGVSLSVPTEVGYFFKEGGILSPDGVCRPFDEKANGTIKGNGCSVIVLKRLQDALDDSDRIYAVVNGTAINNDGASKVGFTAPSIVGQTSSISDALASSGFEPQDIDYIETHGTATRLGDLVELAALYNVFGKVRKKIPLGSLKANIGHLDVAAGISSVIKLIYLLNSGIIPRLANFSKLNPELQEHSHPFSFPTVEREEAVVNCSVSSFGMGGTNAHAIISRYENKNSCRTRPCASFVPLEEKEYWVQIDAGAQESSSDTLHQVIQIWIKAMGESAIAPDSNYLDLGGDSLTALEIIDTINKRFLVELTLANFQNHLTPIKVARWIDTHASSFLCLRKSKNSQKSLFLIHPAGGTTFCYYNLSQALKGDFNLFVIDLPDNYTRYNSMEELAAHYLQEIRKIEPHGPYFLGGYSFGGNLAYEIASQLSLMNERVSKVIMFDSHLPEAYFSVQRSEINYKEAFSEIARFFSQKSVNREILNFFYDKWIYCHKLLKQHFQTRPIPCDMTLFVADEKEDDAILENLSITNLSKELWANRFTGEFRKILTRGNHYSMFNLEHASHLSRYLDKEMI